jgi:hypothetical protein
MYIILNELLLHLIDELSLPLDERATRRILREIAADAGSDSYSYLHLSGRRGLTDLSI